MTTIYTALSRYQAGEIPAEQAASMVGISRRQWLDIMAEHDACPSPSIDAIQRDISALQQSSDRLLCWVMAAVLVLSVAAMAYLSVSALLYILHHP